MENQKTKDFKVQAQKLSDLYGCKVMFEKSDLTIIVDHPTRIVTKIDPKRSKKLLKAYLSAIPKFLKEKNITFVPILYGTGEENK